MPPNDGPPRGPGTPNVQIVKITDIGDTHAEGLDHYGLTHLLPLDARRGKGALPLVGDLWMIDRLMGGWQLGTCIHTTPATITAPVVDGSAQEALLEALAALGFVTDDAERVEGEATGTNWTQWMNVNP